MTMMIVTRTASAAPITCSRLRCRMKARTGRGRRRAGWTGWGNQDMAAKIGRGAASR